MKVWINKYTGSYGGGMIIVAANSAEEAHKTFHKDEKFRWLWDGNGYLDDECEIDNEEDYYYLHSTWHCLENVIANVDIPQVLAEDSYIE